MSRVAISTYLGRVVLNGINTKSRDLKFLRLWLLNYYDEVHFVTRIARGDDPEIIKSQYDVDLNSYDAIVFYNTPVNFFGGVVDQSNIDMINELAKYTGKQYYFFCDPKLEFKDYSEIINNKLKKQVCAPIRIDHTVLYTGIDYQIHLNQKPDSILTKYVNIPFFHFLSGHEEIFTYSEISKDYDLVYYGNNRGGSRNKILKSYFKNDTELKKLWIGYDPDYPSTEVNKKYVSINKLPDMMAKAYTTLIVGDELHNGNYTTARFFEALKHDTIALIDIKYDPNKRLIENENLKKLMYVSNVSDIKKRMPIIKKNYNALLALQRKELELLHTQGNVRVNF